MLRALVISLLILCSLAATLPIVDSFAGGPQKSAAHYRRHRRHSRAWWRRHRAAVRRRRAMMARQARRRALNTQGRLPGARNNPAVNAAAAHALLTPALAPLALPAFPVQPAANMPALAVNVAAPALPYVAAPAPPRKVVAPQWPSAWRNLSNAAGELRFSVRGADEHNAGMVAWTRVAAADTSALAPTKSISGVAYTELRHKVINKMLAEGGWVVNDMTRDLGGRRTFIVVAESAQADGAHTSWVFYFTEFNGQVYGLTTSARVNDAPALAADAEQFVGALNSRARAATLAASEAQR